MLAIPARDDLILLLYDKILAPPTLYAKKMKGGQMNCWSVPNHIQAMLFTISYLAATKCATWAKYCVVSPTNLYTATHKCYMYWFVHKLIGISMNYQDVKYSLWMDNCLCCRLHMSLLQHSIIYPFCINSLHSCFCAEYKFLVKKLQLYQNHEEPST